MMDNRQYIRIRSWHVANVHTRIIDGWVTRCGKRAKGDTIDALPLGAKTCESCLRLTIKDEEHPGG